VDQRDSLADQFAEEVAEQVGIEHAGGFAQRSQGGPLNPEEFLHFVQRAGLLDAAEAGDDGVEEVEQQQGGILVEMELAIASAIARRGVIVQAFQDGVQQFEVFEAAQIGFADLRTTFLCHGIRSRFAGCQQRSQPVEIGEGRQTIELNDREVRLLPAMSS